MDDLSVILSQISAYKVMLDQVNEEFESSIQRTREIESEIVKCSETEKDLLLKEAELTKLLGVKEFEMNSLIQVTVIGSVALEQLKKELDCFRLNREETTKRIANNRENFISLCQSFQRDISNGENKELSMLLQEKEALEKENLELNTKICSLNSSASAYVEVVLEDLCTSNSVLRVDIQIKTSENERLLKDINYLKTTILALSSVEDDFSKSM